MHTIFATFPTVSDAQRALQDLQESPTGGDTVETTLRTRPFHRQRWSLQEGDIRHGVILGATLGALLGIATAFILSWFDLMTAGVWPALIIGVLGSIYGGLAGGLIGAGTARHELDLLLESLPPKGAVIAVAVHTRAEEEEVRELLMRDGAEELIST